MADDESKAPFELNVGTLFKTYVTGDDADVKASRLALVSWFRRRTTNKPKVVFFDDADRADRFEVGGKEVYWDDLAAAWKRGRDAVFTFLGVDVAVEEKATAWDRLVDLLKPARSDTSGGAGSGSGGGGGGGGGAPAELAPDCGLPSLKRSDGTEVKDTFFRSVTPNSNGSIPRLACLRDDNGRYFLHPLRSLIWQLSGPILDVIGRSVLVPYDAPKFKDLAEGHLRDATGMTTLRDRFEKCCQSVLANCPFLSKLYDTPDAGDETATRANLLAAVGTAVKDLPLVGGVIAGASVDGSVGGGAGAGAGAGAESTVVFDHCPPAASSLSPDVPEDLPQSVSDMVDLPAEVDSPPASVTGSRTPGSEDAVRTATPASAWPPDTWTPPTVADGAPTTTKLLQVGIENAAVYMFRDGRPADCRNWNERAGAVFTQSLFDRFISTPTLKSDIFEVHTKATAEHRNKTKYVDRLVRSTDLNLELLYMEEAKLHETNAWKLATDNAKLGKLMKAGLLTMEAKVGANPALMTLGVQVHAQTLRVYAMRHPFRNVWAMDQLLTLRIPTSGDKPKAWLQDAVRLAAAGLALATWCSHVGQNVRGLRPAPTPSPTDGVFAGSPDPKLQKPKDGAGNGRGGSGPVSRSGESSSTSSRSFSGPAGKSHALTSQAAPLTFGEFVGPHPIVWRGFRVWKGCLGDRPCVIRALETNTRYKDRNLNELRCHMLAAKTTEYAAPILALRNTMEPLESLTEMESGGRCLAVVMPELEPMEGWVETPTQAVELLRQMFEFLAAMSKVLLTHRDLSPSNLLRYPDTGQLCVIDWELAQIAAEIEPREADLGTEGYIAPELQHGERMVVATPASDMYSMGRCFVWLVHPVWTDLKASWPKVAELAESMCARAPRDRPNARAVLKAWARAYSLPGSVDTASLTTTASASPDTERQPLVDLRQNGFSTLTSSKPVNVGRLVPGSMGKF